MVEDRESVWGRRNNSDVLEREKRADILKGSKVGSGDSEKMVGVGGLLSPLERESDVVVGMKLIFLTVEVCLFCPLDMW